MALDYLSDAQVSGYCRYQDVPLRSDLERFFLLDDADQLLVDQRRGGHNRLGFALQLTTVGHAVTNPRMSA